MNELFPEETAYNVTTASRLRGSLDIAALRGALTAVLVNNDILRVTFGAVDGVPFQAAGPAAETVLTERDLPGADDARIDQAIAQDATARLDLERGPLYRFTLLRIAPDDHLLICTIHHILVDGWSMGMLNREISDAYGALRQGSEPERPDRSSQFLDFAEQQRNALDDAVLSEQLDFWEKRLANLPDLDVPADRARPGFRSMRGAMVTLPFGQDLAAKLRQVAGDIGVPQFAPLVAAVEIVLSRYSGQYDLPLGVTMFGRDEPEWEHIIGCFVNMVVLRGDLTQNPALREVVQRTGNDLFEAYENAQVPFEKVVSRMQPARDPNRNPLFQVAVQMLSEDNSGQALTMPGISVEPVNSAVSGSRFDMTLSFVESADTLRVDIEYAADLFDKWRVEAMAGHIRRALTEIVRDPDQRLSAMALVTGNERDRILALGQGEASTRSQHPVHAVIARIAAAQPDLLAATCRGKDLTYGELDEHAEQLARYLRSLGVGHEQIVVIGMERGLDFLVALLAVLKAGAAYAVIDPEQPADRLEFILRDTGAQLLLTEATSAGKVPAVDGCPVVCVDTEWAAIESVPADEPLTEWTTRDSLIYVLYTSGSTGKPKGVMLEHRALLSFAESYQQSFNLGPGHRLLQLRPLTFDMAHGEIIAALTCGAALILVPPELATSPEALAELIVTERPTYVGMPTTLLSLVDAGPYPAVRAVMNGGEVIPGELVNKWNLAGRQFVNAYGPTEAAVACTAHECAHRTWDSPPPIGTPYLDRRLYVVDQAQNLVPMGVPGELLIGGDEGLARGYHNQPELTAQRFVPDPVHPGGRVYRTGDLVRWNGEGQLEFIGRRDTQVKVRGHRIELEEIEAVLTLMPEVAMAAAAVFTDPDGDQSLVGYVTLAGPKSPTTSELRSHASNFLPAYMVPARWQVLTEFPLNSAKKIDRGALPAPQPMADDAAQEFTAPRPGTETKMADILADVLRLARVSMSQTFFELGGDSLQAMRVASRLSRAFGIKVNVRVLYGGATIRAVAARIDELLPAAPGSGAK